MKISTARSEPFSAIRRRNLALAGAKLPGAAPSATDDARFMGVTEAELTPAVKAALATLVIELEDLRSELKWLKARLLEAEAAADEDPLTGVKNRRAFLREVKRVSAFGVRYDVPASVVYFDLDDLKGVNDRLGHAAGDAALKAVAERLQQHVRESDIVGRMGGDEFAVILAQADRPTAEAKAAALARAIEAEPLKFGDWSAPLHISWGVREITQDAEPEALVADADQAMYARKRERKSA
jgi:diguanylate cyclase (GGDEF)-like protein